MPDTIPSPENEPERDGFEMADPGWGLGSEAFEGAPITPGVTAADAALAPAPAVDRYAMPEPDDIVPTYVRNEAPWVGISGVVANPDLSVLAEAPAAPGVEPEFTRIVRAPQRWKEAVAWVTTAAFIMAAAWFLPILIVPTSPLGRVGSFATLSVSGLVAVAVLVQTWRWAHRAS